MLFRTELTVPAFPLPVNHRHNIMLLGSCFSQNIGTRLQMYKFNCFLNPFGTVFHPEPIARLMDYVYFGNMPDPDTWMLSQGVYVHPDFHSSLGSTDKDSAVYKTESIIEEMHDKLSSMQYLFITLGTSIGYTFRDDDSVVANCHKIPAAYFDGVDSDVHTMTAALQTAIQRWKTMSPELQVVCTVSPVRHIKDGIVKNMLSKAKLRLVTDLLCKELPYVSYFPAFEWMMDDLRDYRYYEKDLIHPNEQAVDYIWEKFSNHFFTDSTRELIQKIDKILKAEQHRPFNPDSDAHQLFVRQLASDKAALLRQYPWMHI